MDNNSNLTNSSSATAVCKLNTYSPASIFLLGVAGLFVITFGLGSNVICIGIFQHKTMRHTSINWYFTARAVTDFILLITSFFLFTLPRLGQFFENYDAANVSFFITPVIYGVAVTVQTASIYLTVLMTVHRFIGVCFPFKAPTILTGHRVKLGITGVMIFSIIFNITKFFELRVFDYCWEENIQHSIYMLTTNPIRMNETYRTMFYGWFATIIKFFLPFGTLIVMNSKIIQAIRRSQRFHRRLSSLVENPMVRSTESIKEISSSVTLVGIVVVFLTCNSLSLVLNVIEVAGYRTTIKHFGIIVDVSNLLVAVSCSINFFVYCVFSTKFRSLLKQYCNYHKMNNGSEVMLSMSATKYVPVADTYV